MINYLYSTNLKCCIPLTDSSAMLFAPSGISQRYTPSSSVPTSWMVSLRVAPFCSIPYLLLGISRWSSRYQADGSDSSGTSHSSTATSLSLTSTSLNGRLNRTAGPEEQGHWVSDDVLTSQKVDELQILDGYSNSNNMRSIHIAVNQAKA